MTHDKNLLTVIIEEHIACFDFRDSFSKPIYKIMDAHSAPICDLDFNPNKPYSFCTSGEDSKIRFWDIRKPNYLICFEEELGSHWV